MCSSDLIKEKLAYTATNQRAEFAKGNALYYVDSSSPLPDIGRTFDRNGVQWDAALMPLGAPTNKPATVLVGTSLSMMRPQEGSKDLNLEDEARRRLAAWLFIKFFTSPSITARWGLDDSNGYFPVRTSILDDPANVAALKSQPQFSQAFDFARSSGRAEPNAYGWQDIRLAISDALNDIAARKATADQAQKQLVTTANLILSQH